MIIKKSKRDFLFVLITFLTVFNGSVFGMSYQDGFKSSAPIAIKSNWNNHNSNDKELSNSQKNFISTLEEYRNGVKRMAYVNPDFGSIRSTKSETNIKNSQSPEMIESPFFVQDDLSDISETSETSYDQSNLPDKTNEKRIEAFKKHVQDNALIKTFKIIKEELKNINMRKKCKQLQSKDFNLKAFNPKKINSKKVADEEKDREFGEHFFTQKRIPTKCYSNDIDERALEPHFIISLEKRHKSVDKPRIRDFAEIKQGEKEENLANKKNIERTEKQGLILEQVIEKKLANKDGKKENLANKKNIERIEKHNQMLEKKLANKSGKKEEQKVVLASLKQEQATPEIINSELDKKAEEEITAQMEKFYECNNMEKDKSNKKLEETAITKEIVEEIIDKPEENSILARRKAILANLAKMESTNFKRTSKKIEEPKIEKPEIINPLKNIEEDFFQKSERNYCPNLFLSEKQKNIIQELKITEKDLYYIIKEKDLLERRFAWFEMGVILPNLQNTDNKIKTLFIPKEAGEKIEIFKKHLKEINTVDDLLKLDLYSIKRLLNLTRFKPLKGN